MLIELEQRLLTRPSRSDRRFLDKVLDEEFNEIGQSGKLWNKASIMASLLEESTNDAVTAEDFSARFVGDDVAIVRYRTHTAGRQPVQRSSIWRKRSQRWQLYFHQGTPAPSVESAR